MRRNSTFATASATAVVALLAVGLSACGAGDSDISGEVAAIGAPAANPAEEVAEDVAGEVDLPYSDAARSTGTGAVAPETPPGTDTSGTEALLAQDAKMIRTGTVALRSEDVDQTRFEVIEILDAYAGTIASDETSTDQDGLARTVRLVLRVPSQDFRAAIEQISKLATLNSVSSDSVVVTSDYIDTKSRLTTQKASIARITALLSKATSIAEIVAIEAELSQRQATLDSLAQQLRYLEDQTALSTLTVSIARTDVEPSPVESDDAGFVGGLHRGWDALASTVVGIGTAVGLLLPFTLVLAVIAVALRSLRQPIRALARRRTRVPATPD
ncbi:MAG: DUF4349 domain-containing protein [Nocardioides sp.]